MAAYAQQVDAVKELQRIKSYYDGPELKHVVGQMVLMDKDKGKQVDKVDFEYWLKGNEIFTKMNYIEMLSNNSVYVMVNHKRKSIFARPVGQVTPKVETPFFDANQLKTLLNVKGTSAKLESLGGGVGKLILSGLANSRFNMVSISYEQSSGKILGLDATINSDLPEEQGLILKVRYSFTEKSLVKTSPQALSAAKYLENINGEFRFVKLYQNYQKL